MNRKRERRDLNDILIHCLLIIKMEIDIKVTKLFQRKQQRATKQKREYFKKKKSSIAFICKFIFHNFDHRTLPTLLSRRGTASGLKKIPFPTLSQFFKDPMVQNWSSLKCMHRCRSRTRHEQSQDQFGKLVITRERANRYFSFRMIKKRYIMKKSRPSQEH